MAQVGMVMILSLVHWKYQIFHSPFPYTYLDLGAVHPASLPVSLKARFMKPTQHSLPPYCYPTPPFAPGWPSVP